MAPHKHQNLASAAKDPSGLGREHLTELIGQFAHRILSLDADLRERARDGSVSPQGYARRLKQLGKMQTDLAALRQLAANDTPEHQAQVDVGLPVLVTCSPPEKAICDDYLTVRKDTTAAAAAEAETVLRWLQDAAHGKGNALQTTLRLSKMRKLITKHEERFAVLTAADAAQEQKAETLLDQFKGRHLRALGKSTLEGLVRIYEELDAASSRIARLKTAFKREERQARKMHAMIEALREQVRKPLPFVPPPAPGELVDFALKAEDFTAPGLKKTRERRLLVERFWHEVLHKPRTTTLRTAPRKLPTVYTGASIKPQLADFPGDLPPLSQQFSGPEIYNQGPNNAPDDRGPAVE